MENQDALDALDLALPFDLMEPLEPTLEALIELKPAGKKEEGKRSYLNRIWNDVVDSIGLPLALGRSAKMPLSRFSSKANE